MFLLFNLTINATSSGSSLKVGVGDTVISPSGIIQMAEAILKALPSLKTSDNQIVKKK